MSRKSLMSLWPVLSLLVSMSSVQGSASLAKYLFPILGPAGMAAWRLVFSAIMLVLIFKPWKKPIAKQAIWPIIIYGVATGFMNLSFYNAIERIPVGVAVALELAAGPIAVALFASRRLSDFCWLGLAILGLGMLLPLNQASAALDPVGILFALTAGCGWSLYIIFGKKAATLHGPSSVALGSCIAGVMIFPIGVATSSETLFSLAILPMAFLVAILASALPYAIEMIALPRMTAKTFSMLMSLSPVLGCLSGFLFLQEKLAVIQWVAIFCIVFSSIGTVLTAQRQSKLKALT